MISQAGSEAYSFVGMVVMSQLILVNTANSLKPVIEQSAPLCALVIPISTDSSWNYHSKKQLLDACLYPFCFFVFFLLAQASAITGANTCSGLIKKIMQECMNQNMEL